MSGDEATKHEVDWTAKGLLNLNEGEYLFLSTLFDMEDEELRQEIHLDIWKNSHVANSIKLQSYLDASKASECEEDFEERARAILDQG